MPLEIKKWNGRPITAPGFYSGVPIEVYHSQDICNGPSVSSSGLRHCLEENDGSPAHFYSTWSGNPKRIEQKDPAHFRLGRAAHHLLLGQPNFAKLFAISPYENFRTNESKDWRDGEILKGRTVLTQADIEIVRGMSARIGRNRNIVAMLSGKIELSGFWIDHQTGLWVKIRPDSVPTTAPNSVDAADLKTATSVQRDACSRAITDFAYHQQAGLIIDGFDIIAGIHVATFSLVFIETDEPYCIVIKLLDDQDIELGRVQNRMALDTIARCIRENRWPGPSEGEIEQARLTDRYRSLVNRRMAEAQQERRS